MVSYQILYGSCWVTYDILIIVLVSNVVKSFSTDHGSIKNLSSIQTEPVFIRIDSFSLNVIGIHDETCSVTYIGTCRERTRPPPAEFPFPSSLLVLTQYISVARIRLGGKGPRVLLHKGVGGKNRPAKKYMYM